MTCYLDVIWLIGYGIYITFISIVVAFLYGIVTVEKLIYNKNN